MLTYFKKTVSRLTALALAAWLAAPGCAAGCKTASAAAGGCQAGVGETTLTEPASMTEASGHACCHWRGAEENQQSPAGLLEVAQQFPNTMPCCGAGGRAATAALLTNVIPASAANPASRVPAGLPADATPPAQPARRTPPTGGGRTHLRCCVFLI